VHLEVIIVSLNRLELLSRCLVLLRPLQTRIAMKHARNVDICSSFECYSPHRSISQCRQRCTNIFKMADTNWK